MHPTLAELESRAGASYDDRDAWLADRLRGLTATQVRELYLQGAGYRARLLKEKANGLVEPLLSNQYIDWGNVREPIIADWVKQRFAIEAESRVFRAVDNDRFLVSPDGVGLDFDGNLVVSEIKTGKDDLHPDGEAFVRKGYRLQMMWSMRVTGARRCLYVWEQHDSDWQDRGAKHFEPAPLHDRPQFAWIDYDEALAAELEAIAVEFLNDLDTLVRDLADGVKALIDDELDTLAVNYLRYIDLEKEATGSKKGVWALMLERLEGCDALTQEGPIARVTYTPPKETEVDDFDIEAAAEADPRLHKQLLNAQVAWNEHLSNYMKRVKRTTAARLTVTAIKNKEMKA